MRLPGGFPCRVRWCVQGARNTSSEGEDVLGIRSSPILKTHSIPWMNANAWTYQKELSPVNDLRNDTIDDGAIARSQLEW